MQKELPHEVSTKPHLAVGSNELLHALPRIL